MCSRNFWSWFVIYCLYSNLYSTIHKGTYLGTYMNSENSGFTGDGEASELAERKGNVCGRLWLHCDGWCLKVGNDAFCGVIYYCR